MKFKKGDAVNTAIRNMFGLPKSLYVRHAHKDQTYTLEDLAGRLYGRFKQSELVLIDEK